MAQSRDRSFCCGGADVALWHDIEQEEMRMGEMRIRMAMDAGANIIVTACPFCLMHFEDAIKTLDLEDRMRVVDLMVQSGLMQASWRWTVLSSAGFWRR